MSYERVAEDLMDSIRVRSELDAFASVWKRKASTDAERLVRLTALLKVLPSVVRQEEAQEIAPKLPPKVAVGLENEAPLTREQIAEIKAEDRANAPQMTEDQVRELVVKTYGRKMAITLNGMEPAYRVPTKIDGHAVPMQGWEGILKRLGVGFQELEVRVTPGAKYFDLVPM